MIARMNSIPTDVPEKEEHPSTVQVNLNKDKMPDSCMKIGCEIEISIKGKVSAVHQDEYGKSMRIDIDSIETEDEE